MSLFNEFSQVSVLSQLGAGVEILLEVVEVEIVEVEIVEVDIMEVVRVVF